MKRYFRFQTPPERNAYRPRGLFYWLRLPSGGCLGVLTEEGGHTLPGWVALPGLLTMTGAGLCDFGCQPSDTMYQAAVKLGKVNENFHP